MFHNSRQISVAKHAILSFRHVFMFRSTFGNEGKALETDGTESDRSYQAVNQNILCTYVVLALEKSRFCKRCDCLRACESNCGKVHVVTNNYNNYFF
jgi:hypothetical protein